MLAAFFRSSLCVRFAYCCVILIVKPGKLTAVEGDLFSLGGNLFFHAVSH